MTDPQAAATPPPRAWRIGAVTVTRVYERDLQREFPLVFPDVTRAEVKAIPWLIPHFADVDGCMVGYIQSFVVDTGDLCLLVDTCVGNDKDRERVPRWHRSSLPFLERMEAAGYPPERIDAVLCTHMHGDHIGWNTRLVDGRWVPTFPNATYYFAQGALAEAQAGDSPFERASWADSLEPVVAAGLAREVSHDAELAPGLRLVPTPGHTPTHVSLAIESAGMRGFITGDCIHHPGQMARLDWTPRVDGNPEAARATRRRVLEAHADTPTLFIGTHFAGPTAGRVVSDGDVWRLVWED